MKNPLFIIFFALIMSLAFCANKAQATWLTEDQASSAVLRGTLPGTPDGTLPATETPNGTLPSTPGNTLPATETPGGTIPATATPSSTIPPNTLTPIATGTPPGVPTPSAEPTTVATPDGNLPQPEAVINLSIGVNKQRPAIGDVIVFSILIGNISADTLRPLELEVTTPTHTRFVSSYSSSGWQLVTASAPPTVMAASTEALSTEAASPELICPDGARAGTICAITLPSLTQDSIAIADYAVLLDESTLAGASEIELNVRINGADFSGVLTGGVTVDIDPTRRQFLPLIQQ